MKQVQKKFTEFSPIFNSFNINDLNNLNNNIHEIINLKKYYTKNEE